MKNKTSEIKTGIQVDNFPIIITFLLFCFYSYGLFLSLLVSTLMMSWVIIFLSQIFLILFLIRKYSANYIFQTYQFAVIFGTQFILSFIPVVNIFPWTIWFIYLDYKGKFVSPTLGPSQLEGRNAGLPLPLGGVGVGFDLEKIKAEIKAEITLEMQEKKVINQTLIEPINEIKKTNDKTRLKGLHFELFKQLRLKPKNNP